MSATEFTIVQGPDRLAILMAFARYSDHVFFNNAGHFQNAVLFVTKDGKRDTHFQLMVASIQHKDASGTCWNIEGYLVAANPLPACVSNDAPYKMPGHRHLIRRALVEYRTDKKSGSLKVLPQ